MYEMRPPYASMVIVEVFRDYTTKKYEVRFLFRNRTSPVTQFSDKNMSQDVKVTDDDQTKPYVKHLLGKCGEFCSLENFERMTSHLRLNTQQWKDECNLVTDPVIQVKQGIDKD